MPVKGPRTQNHVAGCDSEARVFEFVFYMYPHLYPATGSLFKFVEGLTKSQYATQASEHTEGATSPYELRI